MGYHHTPITADNVIARIAERDARETMQLESLHEALGHLIAMRKTASDMGAQKVLWADWHFAKAMHDLYGDDSSKTMLQEASDNLGIDEEGEDSPFDADGYGDYLFEQQRDRKLDEMAAARSTYGMGAAA